MNDVWLAGFIEGEGSFSLYFAPNGRPEVRFQICSTDYDVISKVYYLIGYGSFFERKSKNKLAIKPIYGVGLSGNKQCMKLIDRIYSYMGERRKSKMDEIRREINDWKGRRKK